MVFKNFLSLMSVRVTVPLISFVLFVVIARMMGADFLGKYTLLLTLLLIFQAIASMGMGTLLVRQVASGAKPVGRLYYCTLLIGAFSVLAWAPVLVGFVWFSGFPNDVLLSSFVLAAALPFAYLCVMNEAAFMGMEKFEYIIFVNAGESLLLLVGSLLVLFADMGLVALSAVLAAGKLASALTGLAVLSGRFGIRPSGLDRDILLRQARMIPSFFILYVSIILFYKIDVLQLALLVPERDLGLYSAASKLYLSAVILPDSLCNALYPRLSRLAVDGQAGDVSLKYVKYSVVCLTPVVLAFFAFSGPVVVGVFGEGFSEAAPVLDLLIWTILPFTANSILGYALLAGGHQKASSAVAFTALMVNVVLNYALISYMGYRGAALATVVAVTVCLLLNVYFLKRLSFRFDLFKDFFYICIPAAAGGTTAAILASEAPWTRLAVALLTAGLAALLLKVVEIEELKSLKSRASLYLRR